MPKTKVSKSKALASRRTKRKKDFFVHKTAILEEDIEIGKGTKIWHFAQIRQGTKLGQNCVIGKSVFIDFDSQIGDKVKIQNHAIIYHQALIEDGVFIGPNVCFTNDKIPRAINSDGSLKSADDWQVSTIKIGRGAAVGGHSVLLPGVSIGQWALVGSGSTVTKDVPDFALVYGNPAEIRDFVCKCGQRLKEAIYENSEEIIFQCSCGEKIIIPKEIYNLRHKDSGEEKQKIWLR